MSCWEILLRALSTLGTVAVAVLSFFLWKVNRAIKDLQEQRQNPDPVLIRAQAVVASPESRIHQLSGYVLHVNLWLSNPGDNPIHLKELTVDTWDLEDLLAERTKNIRYGFVPKLDLEKKTIIPEDSSNTIPPRGEHLVIMDFLLKDGEAVLMRSRDRKVSEARLILDYVAGTKQGSMPIQVSVAGPVG